MIEVKISFKDDKIQSFVINSHALIGREAIIAGEAYDMVCNSVSVLSQSVIIGLDDVLELNVNYDIGDGYVAVNLEGLTQEEVDTAQILLKTFEKSLESVILSLNQMFGEEKCKEYITLKKEEV